MDPHYKYLDHEGWQWADGYDGWWKRQYDIDNLVRNRNLIEPADLAWLRNLYDEEIAYTDSQIERLLQALKKADVLDRTLILVVVDHGEEFLDHGNLSHTTTLYEELVHVPMIIVPPGAAAEAGSVRNDVVETRGVFSTVLESLGIDFALGTRSPGLLTPQGAGGTAPPDSAPHRTVEPGHAFSMVWLPDAQPRWGKQMQIVSLRTARWKLIHHVTRGRYELYDIEADPHEKTNLLEKESEVAGPLRAELDAWLAEQSTYATNLPQTSGNGEHTERMRALGY
jgi:arylsulfatase A-like enzyme